jgi:hypothetical protein
MTLSQIKRLIRLQERAERHSDEYRRFSADLSRQSKALGHLRKAERLYGQIADLIREAAPFQFDAEERGSGSWFSREL